MSDCVCAQFSPEKTSILGHTAWPEDPAGLLCPCPPQPTYLINEVRNDKVSYPMPVTSYPGESCITQVLLIVRPFLVDNLWVSPLFLFQGLLASYSFALVRIGVTFKRRC